MTVYLLHFDQKFKHAQHYIGYTSGPVKKRIEEHRSGNGARLIQVITQQGIGFSVAKTWHGKSRRFERQLKNRHGANKFCPICRRQKHGKKQK
jgi:predicted GIY-YIG superfamily endonuclease